MHRTAASRQALRQETQAQRARAAYPAYAAQARPRRSPSTFLSMHRTAASRRAVRQETPAQRARAAHPAYAVCAKPGQPPPGKTNSCSCACRTAANCPPQPDTRAQHLLKTLEVLDATESSM
eukprot:15240197-Alexandrium_andersonii.AAC.1